MREVSALTVVSLAALFVSSCGQKATTSSGATGADELIRVVNRPEDAAFHGASNAFDVTTRQGEFGVYNLVTPKPGVSQVRSTPSNSVQMVHAGNALVVTTIDEQAIVSLSGTPVLSSELLRGGEGTLRLEVPLLNFARENSRLFRTFHESLEMRLHKSVFYSLEVVCPTRVKIGETEVSFQTDQRVCRLNQPIVGRLDTPIDATTISLESVVEVPVTVGVRPVLGLVQISLNRDRVRDEILQSFQEASRKSVPFSEALGMARSVIRKVEADPVARLPNTEAPNFKASELELISTFFESTTTGLFRLRSTPRTGEPLETKTFEEDPNAEVLRFKGNGAASLLGAISVQAVRTNLTPEQANQRATTIRLPLTLLADDDAYLVVSAVHAAHSTTTLGSPQHIDNVVCLSSSDGCDRGQYECVDPTRLVNSPGGETRCTRTHCVVTNPGTQPPLRIVLEGAGPDCSRVPPRFSRWNQRVECFESVPVQVPFCSAIPSPPAVTSWIRNSSIPPAENYRFRCDAPRVVCDASENRWLERSVFSNPYLNDTVQPVLITEDLVRSIAASVSVGGQHQNGELALNLSSDRKSIHIKSNQLIHEPEFEISSQIPERSLCGSRVLQWDRRVVFYCNLPGQSSESSSMTEQEERDLISRGEIPGIQKTFYPSHIIQFQLLIPNRNEVPL